MFYSFTRVLARFILRLFFRNVHLSGLENIPKNTPVIISSNHPNAYVEAVLIGCLLPFRLSILVRADVFKNPVIRKILETFHLIPVYRLRDGKNQMHKNTESFSKAIQRLEKKHAILIFSEGTSQMGKHLLPFKKGTVRIGFQAYEILKKEVAILPVSVNYSFFMHQQKSVCVHVNKPLMVSSYYSQQEVQKYNNIQKMTKALQAKMAENIVTVPINTLESFQKKLEDYYTNTKVSFWKTKTEQFLTIQKQIALLKTPSTSPRQNSSFLFTSLLELPFVLLGLAIHYATLFPLELLTKAFGLDREFYLSIWISLSLIFTLFFLMILFIVFPVKPAFLLLFTLCFSLLSLYRAFKHKSLSPLKNKI